MSSCRFPKLEECAHFHYELVQLGSLTVNLVDEKSDSINSNAQFQSFNEDTQSTSQAFGSLNDWFIMKITTDYSENFLIKRSFDNVKLLDEMLHRCVFDRKISLLKNLSHTEIECAENINQFIKKYFERFSTIATDSITCGKILTWFQLDNKGRRLPLADTEIRRSINTPAVGAAYGVRKYTAQAPDEISIDVGDMISVIDMPSPTESLWWRGKKNHLQKNQYEVGFFPQNCVATIGDKIPRNLPLLTSFTNQLFEETSPTKPVLRKHGKLIAFFRSFILSRPSRRRLKQRGIYRERVFSCDLSEHLLNSGQTIPIILKTCAEFLEQNGIIDGIYRLSGITSNIQKLRRAFDEERIPDMNSTEMLKDIHAVSSVLKMYFRELPNPLCTYQLYDNFVDAIQKRNDDTERLRLMKETVLMLPPPHYRTLKHLSMHLNKISRHSNRTGMTDKNLAIVWAPNLLRSPAIESGGITALRGVGIQAVVTEYLIKNYVLIFESIDIVDTHVQDQKFEVYQDFSSITSEQSCDSSISIIEKSKYFNSNRPNLISLEEAQERKMKADNNIALWSKSDTTNARTPTESTNEISHNSSHSLKKYHTLLPVPRTWQKRKTTSWKSLFSKNIKTSNSTQEIKLYKYVYPTRNELGSVGEENLIKNADTEMKQNLSPNLENDKTGDLFSRKPIEVYVRSSSIDSGKTVQCHSRSVSHDSYFGSILQSPILNLKSFCCKEFTELVLNFDREEPEMRIFSESESLLSSPKDGFCSSCRKEKPNLKEIPPTIISASNSITCTSESFDFPNNFTTEQCIRDELSNQYILEDHLSDIEFIDSYITPEHNYRKSSINKLFSLKPESLNLTEKTLINQPADAKVKCGRSISVYDLKSNSLEKQSALSRYSYPNIMANNVVFGEYNPEERYVKRKQKREVFRINDGIKLKLLRNNSMSEIQRNKDLNAYVAAELLNSPNNRSLSSDTISSNNESKNLKISDMRTMSAATLSSTNSPRYTLLLLDTCSEPSSAMNTPIGNVNILNKIEEENMKIVHGNKHIIEVEMNKVFQQKTSAGNDKDILRQKLHLDLNSITSTSEHNIMNSSSNCNISNMTVTSDNTSQSLTPSEFGYVNFTRQSNVVSSENSPNIENIDFTEPYREQAIVSPKTNTNCFINEIRSVSASNLIFKTEKIRKDESQNPDLHEVINDNDISKEDVDDKKSGQNKNTWEKHSPKRRKESRFKSFESVTEHNSSRDNYLQFPNKEFCNKKPFVSVREIATKFEVSRGNKVQPPLIHINKTCKDNENSLPKIRNCTKLTNKSFSSCRSLDENTFNFCIDSEKNITKSLHNFNDTKYKSVEISLPKHLNPPKFLPHECSSIFISKDIKKSISKVNKKQSKDISLIDKDCNIPPLFKEITIKKDQHNLGTNIITSDSNLLRDVKLDRERIEKIKEQRRHQLSEKHNVESFISTSKTKAKEYAKIDFVSQEPSMISKPDLSFINRGIIVSNSSKKLQNEKSPLKSQLKNISSNSCLIQLNFENPQDILKTKTLSKEIKEDECSNSLSNTTESKIKEETIPVFKIRDVTAIFESRSQNI